MITSQGCACASSTLFNRSASAGSSAALRKTGTTTLIIAASLAQQLFSLRDEEQVAPRDIRHAERAVRCGSTLEELCPGGGAHNEVADPPLAVDDRPAIVAGPDVVLAFDDQRIVCHAVQLVHPAGIRQQEIDQRVAARAAFVVRILDRRRAAFEREIDQAVEELDAGGNRSQTRLVAAADAARRLDDRQALRGDEDLHVERRIAHAVRRGDRAKRLADARDQPRGAQARVYVLEA